MKRSGFTMIELVFVIVILGILASVAIPKLAATRDDAKISKAASEVSTLVSDMGAYYTGHGTFDDLVKMSNVQLTKDKDKATVTAPTKADLEKGTVYYNDLAGKTSCLSFKISAIDGNLTVKSESNKTAFCKGVNQAIKDLVKTHQFGGSSVSFN
jgi:general secretion pathway protein G